MCPSGKEDFEKNKETPYDDTRVDVIFSEPLGVYKPHRIGSFTCSSIGIGLNSNEHHQPTSIDIDSDDDDACEEQSRRVMLVADETPSEPPGLDLPLNGNPHKPPGLGPSLTSSNNGGTVKIPSEPPEFDAFSSLNENDIDRDDGHETYWSNTCGTVQGFDHCIGTTPGEQYLKTRGLEMSWNNSWGATQDVIFISDDPRTWMHRVEDHREYMAVYADDIATIGHVHTSTPTQGYQALSCSICWGVTSFPYSDEDPHKWTNGRVRVHPFKYRIGCLKNG